MALYAESSRRTYEKGVSGAPRRARCAVYSIKGAQTAAFYTIGHSTRSIEEFGELLRENGIKLLADVRTIPRSRTNPQFNTDILPDALAAQGIDYRHLAELGGLRGKRKDQPQSPNDFWENASFRNYADYADTDAFRDGLQTLRALGHEQPTAIMCAEAVWWRCHRRIITDYLIAAGEDVFHIMGTGKVEPARLTPVARQMPDGSLLYSLREMG
jgi:uncharacterized protein (DUF488 family)